MSEAAAQQATAAPAAEAAPAAPAGPPKGRKVDVLEQFKAVEAAEKAKEAAPAPAAAAEPAKDGAAEQPAAEKKDKPNPADWKSFRTEQRAWRAKVNDYESKLAAREAAVAEREKSPDVLTRSQLKSMLESADLDGIAKVCGANGWRELNDVALKAFADPAYKQNQKMRAELDELKASREKAEKEAQEAAERHQRQVAEREYQESLGERLKESANVGIKEFATETDESPVFRQFVYKKIADHYRETGEELEPDEAADEILRDVIRPRLKRWNAIARRAGWDEVFGAPQTVTEEAAQAAPATRTAVTSAKPKYVTRNAAMQAAPKGGKLSKKEWLEMSIPEMEKAIALEKAQRSA